MAPDASESLSVLISNENESRLAQLTSLVEALGHHVVARETTIDNIAGTTRDELPDVALVGSAPIRNARSR